MTSERIALTKAQDSEKHMAGKAPLLTPGHLASLTWSSWSPVPAALLLATLASDASSGPQVPQALDCTSGLLPSRWGDCISLSCSTQAGTGVAAVNEM